MKLISIEEKVYRIKDKDYQKIEELQENTELDILTIQNKINSFLNELSTQYEPILTLDNMFNFILSHEY
jgi:hypothetical protein